MSQGDTRRSGVIFDRPQRSCFGGRFALAVIARSVVCSRLAQTISNIWPLLGHVRTLFQYYPIFIAFCKNHYPDLSMLIFWEIWSRLRSFFPSTFALASNLHSQNRFPHIPATFAVPKQLNVRFGQHGEDHVVALHSSWQVKGYKMGHSMSQSKKINNESSKGPKCRFVSRMSWLCSVLADEAAATWEELMMQFGRPGDFGKMWKCNEMHTNGFSLFQSLSVSFSMFDVQRFQHLKKIWAASLRCQVPCHEMPSWLFLVSGARPDFVIGHDRWKWWKVNNCPQLRPPLHPEGPAGSSFSSRSLKKIWHVQDIRDVFIDMWHQRFH